MDQALTLDTTPSESAPSSPTATPSAIDPRIRRTRELLQNSLATLLDQKDFDKISVQDITDHATVNRATFYAHYPDKYSLLECLIATRFNGLLAQRGISYNSGCSQALRAMTLGLCDFLLQSPGSACPDRQRHMQPHMESALLEVVRKMVLTGVQNHPTASDVPPPMRAATISGAIYAAAKEWARTPRHTSSEQAADTVLRIIAPIL